MRGKPKCQTPKLFVNEKLVQTGISIGFGVGHRRLNQETNKKKIVSGGIRDFLGQNIASLIYVSST